MSYKIITDSNPIKTDDQITGLRKEMQNYAKRVAERGTEEFFTITNIDVLSAHHKFPGECEPVPKETLIKIGRDFVYILCSGTKVNATLNNWNVGFLGSRWLDMKGEIYGVDRIRAAFYSKKHYGMRSDKEWPYDKPYAIQIMVEK